MSHTNNNINNELTEYDKMIYKMIETYFIKIVDMSDMEKHLIDGVHYTHEGNVEIANRFAKVIIDKK